MAKKKVDFPLFILLLNQYRKPIAESININIHNIRLVNFFVTCIIISNYPEMSYLSNGDNFLSFSTLFIGRERNTQMHKDHNPFY